MRGTLSCSLSGGEGDLDFLRTEFLRLDFCCLDKPKLRCMKKNLLSILLLLFCGQLKAQAIAQSNAVLTFDADTFSFGTVEQGTLIVKEVHFTNTGKINLIIHNVNYSDGGGYAKWPENEIAPGESGVIKLTQQTYSTSGPMYKTAVVASNSVYGSITLCLKGTVLLPPLKFDSTTYHFGKVMQGEYARLEIPFMNTGTEPIKITSCVTSCGCDVADAPGDSIPPGGTGVIKYVFNPNGRKDGMGHKQITIRYKNDQVIVLNIIGEIGPPNKTD